MHLKIVTPLLLSVLSLSVDAATTKHIIGTNWGDNDINSEVQKADKPGDMLIAELYYRYMPHQNFGAEVGYKSAVNGIGSILLSPISEITDVNFSGPRLSAFASYPLGCGFELYSKAGVTYYTLEFTYIVDGLSQNVDKSSLGGEASAGIGWNYKHFGLNAEYTYMKNSDFDSSGMMFGAQLRF